MSLGDATSAAATNMDPVAQCLREVVPDFSAETCAVMVADTMTIQRSQPTQCLRSVQPAEPPPVADR